MSVLVLMRMKYLHILISRVKFILKCSIYYIDLSRVVIICYIFGIWKYETSCLLFIFRYVSHNMRRRHRLPNTSFTVVTVRFAIFFLSLACAALKFQP